jgi:ABC-2 type transport system ATP-binding protein
VPYAPVGHLAGTHPSGRTAECQFNGSDRWNRSFCSSSSESTAVGSGNLYFIREYQRPDVSAIDIAGLTKRYEAGHLPWSPAETVTAVDDLDLTVEDGEVFGFLGPNGAGKSTTINVLLDYVRPTAGRVEVFGIDAQRRPAAVHDRVGVLPENLGLWDRLNARQHLRFSARTKGVDADPAVLLERVGLADAADRPAGEYSTGMAQRLGLALALVGDPDLLVLDEPTAGLDPNGVRLLRDVVREEVDRGATVFFSSHVLEQVEAVCDRVAILNEGELVALDSVEGLRRDLGMGAELTLRLDAVTDPAVDAVRAVDGVVEAATADGELVATCSTGPAKVAAIDAVREAGAAVEDVAVASADLEALFTAYAGDGGERA